MAVTKALSTYKTYFMIGTKAEGASDYTFAKLIDIVDFPDLQPEPETIDVTTLSDGMRQYILGIQDPGGNLSYGANYTPANYAAVKALDDGESHRIAVWFGSDASGVPNGSMGKFSYDAYIKPQLVGGGVNEKRSMNIITTPVSDIDDDVTAA
ncbi:MAG: phage tail protein [Firmicutes bacterium]|nr:phage tail protein [Bacillota bacterium]